MQKLPIGIRIIIFLLIIGIELGFFNLLLIFKTTAISNNLIFNKIEFEIFFLLVSGVSTMLGIFFINLFRSWTPEMMIEKMQNVVRIDDTIISLQRRKIILQDENPSLKKLDSVFITIKNDEKTSKMK